MRVLVISIAVSVLLELSSSRAPEISEDKRNTRQSILGPSPLNPFYSPVYNKTIYNQGLAGGPGSQFTPRYDLPHTLHYTPQESITVIPNAQPHVTQYQTHHVNSQRPLQRQPPAHIQPPPQPQPQPLQYQQVQYQQQLEQAAQNAQAILPGQSTAQPFYYNPPPPPPTPLSYQGFYNTPAPPLYPNPLYDIPAHQYSNLIDQGYFKYPVYVDPNLAPALGGTPKPMFMKKRTIQDLCAQYAPEEKTVIYVLSQNPTEPPEEIEVPKIPIPTKPSKPEVFFVKYNTPEEAELAQKHIQAQYDALGGTSEISNEGISPITTAQRILSGAQNITRNIQLESNHLQRH